MTEDQKQYAEYLKTPHWGMFRKWILRSRGSDCEECGISNGWAKLWYGQANNIHHLSYRNLGHEKPEDVMILCRYCHDKRHSGSSVMHDAFERFFGFRQQRLAFA